MAYEGKGCPPEEDLGRLVRGVISELERQPVVLHLMVCKECERKVKSLRSLMAQRAKT